MSTQRLTKAAGMRCYMNVYYNTRTELRRKESGLVVPVHHMRFKMSIKRSRGLWKLNLLGGGWYTSKTTSFSPDKISKMADRIAHEIEKDIARRAAKKRAKRARLRRR